jgi:hypothetical protein
VAEPKYPPHQLVVDLANALEGTETPAAEGETARQQPVEDAVAVTNRLAGNAALPELYAFGGYLGGSLGEGPETARGPWQLLYLDAKLLTWLLIDQTSILLRRTVDDATSPYGTRDYVWLKADASVSRGEGPPQPSEIQARFLRGGFVSAGDFAATLAGGTYAAPTGPACPLTPGCCGRGTR